jgi:hypothetical protein
MPAKECSDCASGNLSATRRGGFPSELSPVIREVSSHGDVTQGPIALNSTGSPPSIRRRSRNPEEELLHVTGTVQGPAHNVALGSSPSPPTLQKAPNSATPTVYDSPADRIFDLDSSDLPYTRYLFELRDALPGVSGLLDIVADPLGDGRNRNGQSERRYIAGEHIVVGEILKRTPGSARWHDIDFGNPESLAQHSQILAGAGDSEDIAVRYLVMDDFSSRAAEVLGHNFGIDPGVFLQHLHQSLEGSSVENFHRFRDPPTGLSLTHSPLPSRTMSTPFVLRNTSALPNKETTRMVICPTDMHLVPVKETPRQLRVIKAAFEARQLQRVPRPKNEVFDRSILDQLGLRSFMSPSVCEDFGPFLPLWVSKSPMEHSRYTPFQRFTLERSDHVIIHVPSKAQIPTGMMTFTVQSNLLTLPVLVLRTPSAWNSPIEASDLGSLHEDVSDGKAQWHVLASPDYFLFGPVPHMAGSYAPPEPAVNAGPAHGQRQDPSLAGLEQREWRGSYPNFALCQSMTDWHQRCCADGTISPEQTSTPATIYFLERALSRLKANAIDDYKRAYEQCSDSDLNTEEQHRLLIYCRTRALRWDRLTLENRRMVDDLQVSFKSDAGMSAKVFYACSDQLRLLIQQIEDQLQKTKDFVALQLEHIGADQQRKVVHNQIELSQVQIAESRKAIEQTETVRKLTILAFVFIPASTICSFFGMNIQELDHHPQMWVFCLTLVLVVAVVIAIATADDILNLLMRIFAAMPAAIRYRYGEMSWLRRLAATILLLVVHIPFTLAFKAIQSVTGKWKHFLSEGRAYRAGYQDPNLLDRSEGSNVTSPRAFWTQKGAYMAYRLEGIFDDSRRSWREFWAPESTEESR